MSGPPPSQAPSTVSRPHPAPGAGGAPVGRVPDFFIVGHPKSGTTALYEMLRAHPQIFLPANKEPWYFAQELHLRPPPRPAGIAATLEQYLATFAPAGPDQRVGEASAMYLWSRTAAERIAAVAPGARIIAILREPASFLRSLHLQFLETHVESEPDFRTALALEPARREGKVPEHTYWPLALHYSEYVRYAEQLRRYRERFGAERVLVLVYDDFRRENEATVRGVLRFLEVDDTLPLELVEANPTVGVRSQRLHELVHAVTVGRGRLGGALKRPILALTPRRLRRAALYTTQRKVLYGEPPPADERLMSELRERFRGEVAAAGEYIGRDLLTLWGYDDAR